VSGLFGRSELPSKLSVDRAAGVDERDAGLPTDPFGDDRLPSRIRAGRAGETRSGATRIGADRV